MKKCSECNTTMKELAGKTPEGVEYSYYKCIKCGEEIVDMNQLHAVATKYRIMKNYHVKISKWGFSLGMRIPREIIRRYKFKDNAEVVIIPEAEGIRVLPC